MKEESSDDPKSSSDEKNRDEKDTKGKNLFFLFFGKILWFFNFLESAKVTIVGQPEAQWKAQFCIFDKLKQEGWFGQEEGRLTSQITIPGILVGRVIGKGGVNVRELQVIKFIF